MIAATVLAVFIVPVLYVVIDRIAERGKQTGAPRSSDSSACREDRLMRRSCSCRSRVAGWRVARWVRTTSGRVAAPAAVPRRERRARHAHNRCIAGRHQVVRSVPGRSTHRLVNTGARRRTTICGSRPRGCWKPARNWASPARSCSRTSPARRSLTSNRGSSVGSIIFIPPGTNLDVSLHTGRLSARLGTRCLGTHSPPDGSGARAVLRHRRSPARRGHHTDRRCHHDLLQSARSGPGAGHREENAWTSPRTACASPRFG